ncbi:MAG: vitamin B12-dependent ribonucleotide reductase [Acidobacteria bacterium]|nr:MAG: vitamin B12-dependent ribonucleotide reductase [Acidobacteriota bacterium]
MEEDRMPLQNSHQEMPAREPEPTGTTRPLDSGRAMPATTLGGGPGLTIRRLFTREGQDPFEAVDWEKRTASITSGDGTVVFEQKDVEVPKSWSQTATNIVAQKYFRGTLGTPERESSVRQLVSRVVDTITRWGEKGGYFATAADRDAFHDELVHMLLNQQMAFNSPVWFNCGIEPHPQVSACFINSVQDSMASILDLAKTEGMLFKYGSGTGSNLSVIRSSKEKLAGGGTASGPVSFMRGYDAFAGVIKSGGKTRRAAKMVILNADHPDIEEFVLCKVREERKAHALIEAGYDPSFNVPGGAYDSVFFQNANHSVRVTDEFMRAVVEDGEWTTREVTTGKPVETMKARDLFRKIAEAAWECGDPGLQFDTTINRWNPCKNSGRINASNPCSEYMFLDDSACNLASLNLRKFLRSDGTFDVEAFRHAVSVTFLAQEILVDNASYPTAKIAENSHNFRPIGLGYANLGATLMALGVPYDSDRGRAIAAAITALMSGEAYRTSAEIARDHGGPFPEFEKNREPFLEVIARHRSHAEALPDDLVEPNLLAAARQVWAEAERLGSEYGFRNAQATVLAPTGTIAFMMDCDTTGIEPDLALTKYKRLVGGGMIKIVNTTVPVALRRLGYDATQIQEILDYIDEHETIEGAPHLKEEHLAVFDCSFPGRGGKRAIHWMGHARMMAAVQPFLSGAISKTVNMPESSTVEDVEQAYLEAWRLGLKAIAIYRDGCKRTQPLSTGAAAKTETARPLRRRLPDERESITHKFSIAGHEGYITVGLYPDTRQPGEIFVVMAKQGSVVSGLMDSFATAISLALQYGVPLEVLVRKFSHVRFEPSGFTNNPEIPIAKSIVDYIFRWLALKFLDNEDAAGGAGDLEKPEPGAERPPADRARESLAGEEQKVWAGMADAPPCHECGTIMVRNGACYACINCGATSGCS